MHACVFAGNSIARRRCQSNVPADVFPCVRACVCVCVCVGSCVEMFASPLTGSNRNSDEKARR